MIADSPTTTAPILNLIPGDRWARRQLCSGIKGLSVASKYSKSLTLVRIFFIDTVWIPQLNVRFLHDRGAYSGSDGGRLLGSMPASQ